MATFEETVQQKQRRLQELRLIQARHGINTDPAITIEIEDIERYLERVPGIKSSLDQINIYRRNLEILLQQRSLHGLNVPVHIINQIEEARQKVRSLKASLAKLGIHVEQQPGDEEPPEIKIVRQQAWTPSPDPLERVREGLGDIETFIRHGDTRKALEAVKALRQLLD